VYGRKGGKMSVDDRRIRDRIAQNDVTMARSYLEVDFMEWFSENQIPYGYEAFTIPSVVGPRKEEWDTMVDAIQAAGRNDFDEYDNLTEGTRWEDVRPAEVLGTWNDIYDKHGLQNERVTVEVQRSLSEYSKRMLLPDFALYIGEDFTLAPDGFDWSSWDKIVEVSGLWGVGLPDEATEEDWWDWYRVSAVAYKELAYRLLGLWDDVVYAIPNQPFIEGVSDGIPQGLRRDDSYVIFNTTSASPDLSGLYDALGLSSGDVTQFETRLSPNIELVSYERDLTNRTFRRRELEYTGIRLDAVNSNARTVVVDDGWIVYHGELGEVYFTDDGIHVRESQWRGMNIKLLGEYVTDVASTLSDDGIVENLKEV
jgi:hypothetical protein